VNGHANGDPSYVAEAEPEADEEAEERRPRRGRRGGRGRGRPRADVEEGATDEDAGREDGERVVEGVVELLANGSGFLRLAPPEPTDDDVYISGAQVKRCELVSGDRISGPLRPPRRSERFPSLIRIDTINGRPAEEVAEGTRFEDLSVSFPTERFELGSEDPTVKAIEWLTPFGKGSRVVLAGPPRSGKSEALRRLADALRALDGLEVSLVLAGVRPEELGETGGLSFGASVDAQAQAVEQAIEQGRRVAARGGDAVVLVDTLEYLPPHAARRALAAARNITDGGSLTVIATAPAPLGGETTVVTLDAGLTALGRFPALDLAASGVVRPELLVGEAGAEAIARARTEQLST
jgi:transcription termination factor Rho